MKERERMRDRDRDREEREWRDSKAPSGELCDLESVIADISLLLQLYIKAGLF